MDNFPLVEIQNKALDDYNKNPTRDNWLILCKTHKFNGNKYESYEQPTKNVDFDTWNQWEQNKSRTQIASQAISLSYLEEIMTRRGIKKIKL